MVLVGNLVKRSFPILTCYCKSLEMWMHAMPWGVIASSEAEMHQQPGNLDACRALGCNCPHMKLKYLCSPILCKRSLTRCKAAEQALTAV